jgi:hypothetical protein
MEPRYLISEGIARDMLRRYQANCTEFRADEGPSTGRKGQLSAVSEGKILE